MTSITDWLQTAQGIISAVSAFLLAIAPMATKAIKRWAEVLRIARHDRHINENHVVWHETRKLLAEMVVRSQASRALLLVARNCGWRDASLPVHVSVIGEAIATADGPSVFERWQDWRADPGYRAVLDEVWAGRTDSTAVLVTPNDSMLSGQMRDYYRDTGVAASVMFLIQTMKDGALLYVSLNYGCLRDSFASRPEECDLAAELEKAKRFHKARECVRREIALMRSIWKSEAQ